MKEFDLKVSASLNIENFSHSKIKNLSRLDGGGNNRLYKVITENDTEFLVKEYFPDERRRLYREYYAFVNLHELGLDNIPTPFFIDQENNYAVYSFEEGASKDASRLSYLELEKIIVFLTDLQNIRPTADIKKRFLDALFVTRSLDEFAGTVLYKFGKFEECLSTDLLHPKIAKLAETYELSNLIKGKISRLKSCNPKLFQPIKASEMRLSPVDFGPHNMIFGSDEKIRFVDFEYFGWDDPIKIVSNFVFHEGSRGLSSDNREYFLQRYRETSSLPKGVLDRLEVSIQLSALDWISILLWNLTPQKMASRKFSNENLNIERHLSDQIDKIILRLGELQNL